LLRRTKSLLVLVSISSRFAALRRAVFFFATFLRAAM
jgi:hypothetical protein